jgi:hypothetical protein
LELEPVEDGEVPHPWDMSHQPDHDPKPWLEIDAAGQVDGTHCSDTVQSRRNGLQLGRAIDTPMHVRLDLGHGPLNRCILTPKRLSESKIS